MGQTLLLSTFDARLPDRAAAIERLWTSRPMKVVPSNMTGS
jgi:hypothetical protein